MKTKIFFESNDCQYMQDVANDYLLFMPPELSRWMQKLMNRKPEDTVPADDDEASDNSYYALKARFLLKYLADERPIEENFSGRLSANSVENTLANTKQITFELTERCNLQCRYCAYGDIYGDYLPRHNNDLSWEYARTLIDYLEKYWRFALNGNMQRFRRILADHDDHAKEHIKDMIRDNIAIFNAVDHVVCVTDGSKHVLTDDFHIPESKVTTVHNCLKDAHCRTSKSALRKKYRLPDEWPVIIFAGRLDIIKGLKAAIGAFKRLLKDYPAARLFVCGNGNYDAYMKEISDVCPNVVFTGFVNKRRLYEYYKIADLGVVPSIHEEFGLVTLEMMMHSLPVIVTNNGGPDEIIEDGISGYKIPVRTMRKQQSLDIKIFTDRMKYLLDNKEKAARMGRNARKHFLEAFECSTFRERMLNLYNSLIVK